MSGYLLDSHTLLWAFEGDNDLSRRAGRIIEDSANDVVISIVAYWELQIKQTIGKLRVAPRIQRTSLGMVRRGWFQATGTTAIALRPLSRPSVAPSRSFRQDVDSAGTGRGLRNSHRRSPRSGSGTTPRIPSTTTFSGIHRLRIVSAFAQLLHHVKGSEDKTKDCVCDQDRYRCANAVMQTEKTGRLKLARYGWPVLLVSHARVYSGQRW